MSKPSRELLVACSQLTADDYERWGGAPEVEAGIVDAAKDRLRLASNFAASAKTLANSGDEVDARNAISRAYYACHHAARGLSLYRNRRDRYDHYQAIEHFAKTVGDEAFLKSRLGPRDDVRRKFKQILDHRHLADYHPYGTAEAKEAPLDFVRAAANAVNWAGEVVQAVDEFITNKEAAKP